MLVGRNQHSRRWKFKFILHCFCQEIASGASQLPIRLVLRFNKSRIELQPYKGATQRNLHSYSAARPKIVLKKCI